MAGFKYCTLNVGVPAIQQLTCPSNNCAGKTKTVSINSLDQTVSEQFSWENGEFDNCKIEIEADHNLPMALHVDVANMTNVEYDAYQMPRFFSKSRGYHGLYENPKEYYAIQGNQTFWLPSDYTLILVMRSQNTAMAGNFEIKAYMEDEPRIATKVASKYS